MAQVRIKNRATGKLETHDVDEADKLVADAGGGFDYPSREELARLERVEKHGSTGEQAKAAVETVGRTASFGAWQGFGTPEENEARRQTLREESPGTAFGSQALGAAIPAVAGGAVAEAALGAAGLAGGAVRAGAIVAEGTAGGLADEVEEAAAQGRPVSAGRAMLVGIGGELVGRALPAALRAGAGRLSRPRDAAAVVAGEALEDASGAAAKRARAKLVRDAPDMPPGPDRDAALVGTADEQFKRADAELAKASRESQELLEKLGREAPRELERQLPKTTAHVQVQWSADVAAELGALAEGATKAEAKALRKAAKAIVDADDSQAIWRAAANAREELAELAAKTKPADDLESLLAKSIDEVQTRKAAGGVARSRAGARLLDTPVSRETPPDFATWDVTDFAGQRKLKVSSFQRNLINGLKEDAGFRSTGRVSNDGGNLGSEPTFAVQRNGTVKLAHGKMRILAARELGRDTVYGRVVQGGGKNPKVLFEGQIRVGGDGGAQAKAAPPATAPASPLARAEELLAKRQADPAVWGKAGEAAAELRSSASRGPSVADRVSSLEDQLAAAKRWRVGAEKTRQKLSENAAKMRRAQGIKDDTAKAVAAAGARGEGSRGLLGEIAEEGAEYLFERAVGAAIPGAGFVARRARKAIWGMLDQSGKAQVSRAVRGLLHPVTNQGRVAGAARFSLAATALSRFAGDHPDARAAFHARRDMLRQVAAHPDIAGQVLAESMGELARENPGNFVRLARRLTESLQYVAANMPPTVGVSLAYPTGVPITDSELRDVADLWNTAFEPGTALDAIELGRASPIQMKTLRELHADLYDDVRREVVLQTADTFRSVPSQRRLVIDIMFEADGLGGLFATSEAARYVAQAKRPPAGKPTRQIGQFDDDVAVEAGGVHAVRTGVTNRGVA